MSRLTCRYPHQWPFRIRGYHPLWLHFPEHSTKAADDLVTRLFRVRSPLLTESQLISFPLGTEMFQFPRFASDSLWIQLPMSRKRDGFPHSDISGSTLVCQLPEAYRKLLRPSSPLTAKASTVRAYSLDQATPNDFINIESSRTVW